MAARVARNSAVYSEQIVTAVGYHLLSVPHTKQKNALWLFCINKTVCVSFWGNAAPPNIYLGQQLLPSAPPPLDMQWLRSEVRGHGAHVQITIDNRCGSFRP